MEKSLQEYISEALIKAKGEHQTDANRLVIVKLQEALMWNTEHQRALVETARRSGVGFNGDVHSRRPDIPQTPQQVANKAIEEGHVVMNEPLNG